MTDLFSSLQPWHWIVLTCALLGMEALGAGGFLLGSALASALVALILWLMPELGWSGQLLWFAGFSLLFTVAYWKLFRRVNNRSDHQQLNNRAAQAYWSGD